MKRILSASLLLLLLASWAIPSFAQDIAYFLEFQPYPRVQGLGTATVALRGHPGAISVNPATIGEQGNVRLGTNGGRGDSPIYASDWRSDTFSNWISAPTSSIRRGKWGAAVEWRHFSLGPIKVRDVNGVTLGEVEPHDWAATAAGAYQVTNTLTLGAAVRVIRVQRVFGSSGSGIDQVEKRTRGTGSIDLGVHFEQSHEMESVHLRPRLGWSLTNFGPNLDFGEGAETRGAMTALPMMMRLGGGIEVTGKKKWHARPRIRAGLYGALSNRLVNFRRTCRTTFEELEQCSYEPDGPFRALWSGWTGARNSSVSVWENTNKHLGIEVQVCDVVALRMGQLRQNEGVTQNRYTSYGVGLDLYYLALEHSGTIAENQPVDSFWRLTARLPLDRASDPRNFWPAVLN